MCFQCLAWGLEYNRGSINSSGCREQSTKQVWLDSAANNSQLPALIPTQQWEPWNETRESIAGKLYSALILQWISHSEGAVGSKSPPKRHQILELKNLSQGRLVKSEWRWGFSRWGLYFVLSENCLPTCISKFCSSPSSLPLLLLLTHNITSPSASLSEIGLAY